MINQEFNTILELLQVFNNEQVCIEHLEAVRWGDNVVSPFDISSKVYKCKGNKYRCKNTGKYFNVRTNTLFDNTKIELKKWFLAIWLITCHKKGISSCQLAKDIGTTQKTAWFMLQRIRKCFNISEDNNKSEGVFELDETYIGTKEANRHMKDRVEGLKEKMCIFGMLERNNKTVKAKIVKDAKSNTLYKEIVNNIEENSLIFTDEYSAYKSIPHSIYTHRTVNHSKGNYVKIGMLNKRSGREAFKIHTNTIEGFWSQVKRGINGIYHWASKKHIDKYLNEFSFRYNTRDCKEAERFNTFLKKLECKTTYGELINE